MLTVSLHYDDFKQRCKIHMTDKIYDLIVVGGGINGCGIAADAAGRGLSVALLEEIDLASGTSSASSNLIHGGIRYLEHGHLRLVKNSLRERTILIKMAPHVITPLKFTLPNSTQRSKTLVHIGLFLYDFLAKCGPFPRSHYVRFNNTSPLKPSIKDGFAYFDAWTSDIRLVILNARLAQKQGADIYTRTRVLRAQRCKLLWHLTAHDTWNRKIKNIYGRGLVNATGPWAKQFFEMVSNETSPFDLRLIKGSHLIVPKLHNHNSAYLLQHVDRRIVFVIPYLTQFSLIGTTDIDYFHDPRNVTVSDKEKIYLIDVVNHYFKNTLSYKDILFSYAGVRALCAKKGISAQKATRDYQLHVSDVKGKMPLLSVFGGKLTTYRQLSEKALNKLQPYYPHAKRAWTAHAQLSGGDINVTTYAQELYTHYPKLDPTLIQRLITTYGSCCQHILGKAKTMSDLGTHYGAGFTERELDYLIRIEWAKTVRDVIQRRTKLCYFLTSEQHEHIDRAIKQKVK